MNDLNSVGSMEECEAFAKERNKSLTEGRITDLVEQAIENVANKRVLKDGVVERTWKPGDYERELVQLVVLECSRSAHQWYQYHNEFHWGPSDHIIRHFGVDDE